MKILVLNCGSSSLKYQLLDVIDEKVLAKGVVEKIGLKEAGIVHSANGRKMCQSIYIPNHAVALRMAVDVLTNKLYGVIETMDEIDAVGHRIVHGGDVFHESVLIDESVISEIERLSEIAPLHNPPAVSGIRACQEFMPNKPMVAVFDTSFHQSMPPSSYIYGLGYDMYEKYGIRRYGFHGTSHRYVTNKVLPLLNKPVEQTKIITCHLGNGASIAAVRGGKCYNTSMGYTPLEGLVMGTRCGDIDPAIIPYMMKHLNMSADEIDNYLNNECGIWGISGVSSDMRYVEQEAAAGNERARLALQITYKRIIHYIGGYIAEMNGIDAIVFTAGVGENSTYMCSTICKGLSYFGVDFDEDANDMCSGDVKEVTRRGSKTRVFVIPTNEELLIARETRDIIRLKSVDENPFSD